ECTALFGLPGRLPGAPDPSAQVHHVRGSLHRSCAVDFYRQLCIQPLKRSRSFAKSLGVYVARMVDAVVSAALRQLRRTASCGSPRPLSIRREEFHRGLHNADVPGTRSGIVTHPEWSSHGNDTATATSRN